jgi:ATP-dependent helicase/nuclease subunit A
VSRPDPTAPQLRAANPRNSVWVAASAGTGKTKVLTDRVLALLLAGSAPERLLCLTFTKAAAAEMDNRIAARLAGWATAADATLRDELAPLLGAPPDEVQMIGARRLFARLLDAAGGIRIETIHAFCQSLLRRFPLEAGLPPHFQVMDEREAGELMADAREQMLAEPGLDDAVARITARVHEQQFPELMAQLANERGRLTRLFEQHGGAAAAELALRRRLGLRPQDDEDSLTAEHLAALDRGEAKQVAGALASGKDSDAKRGAAMLAWLEGGAPFEEWRSALLTQEDAPRKTLCTNAVEAARPGTRAWLEAEAARTAGLTDRLKALHAVALTAALLLLAERLIAIYQEHKARRARLDYDDLILHTISLLQQDGGATWVLYKLDGGIDHLLIDEAQDTNPDQWEVIRALTAEFFAGSGRHEAGRRTVFAVGDAKQSIYSFQRADPREFEASRARLAAEVPAAGGGWDEVALEVSFRSVAVVLQAVDAVLAGAGGAGVAPPHERVHHAAFREGMAGQVELWQPVDPRPQDEEAPWKPPVERQEGDNPQARLARLVAARIHAMIARQEVLPSKGRPIAAGDVMVLVRRRNRFVDLLVKSLKRLGVPVAGADRMVLTEQLAVMDLMALAQVLLLPEDDLTLACVLKGPLVGLSEEELFELAWRRQGTLWQALQRSRFGAALAQLSELMAKVDRWTPHELFSHVLGHGGKQRLLARLGPEAEDPIDEFIALTLAFEQSHPPSLQGFLHWLQQGGTEIKRDLDQGEGRVRIMTVHGAKGLQAPILFLPDTLQKPRRRPALLWLEGGLPLWPFKGGICGEVQAAQAAQDAARDAEYRRLLYVAMTRAEDRLFICGYNGRQKAPEDCWYALVREALAPLAENADDAALAALGHDSRVLRLSAPQRAAVPAAARGPAPAAPPPLPGWARGSVPQEPVPPRPLAPSRPEPEPPPAASPVGPGESASRQRGMLIHRLLQSLPDLAEGERAKAAARFLGRPAWGLSFAAQAEIAAEAARVMQDPAFALLFGPGSRAEVPLIGQLGGRVVSGRVDRLWVGTEAVLVVDYKIDRRPPAHPPAAYVRQMAAYRGVLACLYPGRAVRCALLWTDGPRWMPLDGNVLDDALAAMALIEFSA